jgi:membrane protease YdiL (CAAX protease family)
MTHAQRTRISNREKRMETPKAPLRDWSALAFASFFPLLMTYIAFIVLNDPRGAVNSALLTAFALGKIIQFLFPVIYVFCFNRRQIGVPRPTWRGMPIGVGFALAVGVSVYVVYYFWVRHIPSVTEITPRMIFNRLQQFGRDTPPGFLMLAFFICGLHSLWEEYYWRWFVFGWMRRYVPMAAAVGMSSVAFMLHHVIILGVYFPGNFWTLALPFSLCVAVGGGVWAWLYQYGGSLYAPWLSHALIDAAIMGVGYWMLSDYWQ